jgi:hypothetical protein
LLELEEDLLEELLEELDDERLDFEEDELLLLLELELLLLWLLETLDVVPNTQFVLLPESVLLVPIALIIEAFILFES